MNKIELRKISLEFRTLSSQMLKIDSESEFNFIVMFYNYINKTPIIKNYIFSCCKNDYDIKTLIDNMTNWKPLSLPNETNEIVCMVYQILSYLVENPNRFMSAYMFTNSSNKYADKIQTFMRKTVEPFVVALRSFLELELLNIEDNDNVLFNESCLKTIFISYCQFDSLIADLIEVKINEKIGDKIRFSRDIRDVKYKESFKAFMETIGLHDYVIMIVSDRYLKSRNCMYEVLEVLRDKSFGKKLLFLILSKEDYLYYKGNESEQIAANIYSTDGILSYITYWKDYASKLQSQIDQIADPTLSIEQSKELRIIKKIQLDLSEFIEFLKDSKGIPLTNMIKTNFKEIIEYIDK